MYSIPLSIFYLCLYVCKTNFGNHFQTPESCRGYSIESILEYRMIYAADFVGLDYSLPHSPSVFLRGKHFYVRDN